MTEYTILRSRRRTLSLQVLPDGQVLVKAPLLLSKRQIDAFVERKSGWLEKQMQKQAAISALPPLAEEELHHLMQQAKAVIPTRVAKYAKKMGLTYGKVTIRHQKTRWGSCSGKGNLNFNCLLLQVPEAVMDYVIIHELCHLWEMNHSPRFWAKVESILPDYKAQRKWLRDHGHAIIGRQAAK